MGVDPNHVPSSSNPAIPTPIPEPTTRKYGQCEVGLTIGFFIGEILQQKGVWSSVSVPYFFWVEGREPWGHSFWEFLFNVRFLFFSDLLRCFFFPGKPWKKTLTFPYTGCLIGILIEVYEKSPHNCSSITKSPYITLNNQRPVLFIWLRWLCFLFLLLRGWTLLPGFNQNSITSRRAKMTSWTREKKSNTQHTQQVQLPLLVFWVCKHTPAPLQIVPWSQIE